MKIYIDLLDTLVNNDECAFRTIRIPTELARHSINYTPQHWGNIAEFVFQHYNLEDPNASAIEAKSIDGVFDQIPHTFSLLGPKGSGYYEMKFTRVRPFVELSPRNVRLLGHLPGVNYVVVATLQAPYFFYYICEFQTLLHHLGVAAVDEPLDSDFWTGDSVVMDVLGLP